MSDSKIDCPSSVTLTETEIEWLDSVPNAAHDISGAVWCELGTQHPGEHVALAQAEDAGGGDHAQVNYWVRWGDGTHEVINGECCDARQDGPESDTCLLPTFHAGRHLF